MPSFGKLSKARLETCRAEIIVIAEEVIKKYDFTVLCGHRDKEEQNAAYYATPKKSKLAWPQSKHNKKPSQAIDVAPYYEDHPHIRWPDIKARPKTYGKELAAFYILATLFIMTGEKYGISLRSGMDWDGDWNLQDQGFDDLPHIELIG